MSDSARLREAIKRQLKARDLRYVDLARALDVSEATVKRLLSRGGITLERMERICAFLETDFFELARIGRRKTESPSELSRAQETALAADTRLLMVFHLLCNDWQVDAIQQHFGLSASSVTRFLARLDRLRLIDLQPGNRLRLRVARDFAWRPDGPVLRRYARSAVVEFMRGDFSASDALLRLEVKELGPASLALLRRRLERVVSEFNDLAEVDASLPAGRRRSVGLVLGLRPWVFSLLQSLTADAGPDRRRRKSPAPGLSAHGPNG